MEMSASLVTDSVMNPRVVLVTLRIRINYMNIDLAIVVVIGLILLWVSYMSCKEKKDGDDK